MNYLFFKRIVLSVLGIALLSISACNLKTSQTRIPANTTQLEPYTCSPAQAEKELAQLFEAYGKIPRFLINPIASSLRNCLGDLGYEIALYKAVANKSIASNQILKNGRQPAADEFLRSYQEFKAMTKENPSPYVEKYDDTYRYYTNYSAWDPTLEGVGNVSSYSGPYASAFSTYMNIASHYMKANLEEKGLQQLHMIMQKGGYRPELLNKAMQIADPVLRRKAYKEAFLAMAIPGVDINRIIDSQRDDVLDSVVAYMAQAQLDIAMVLGEYVGNVNALTQEVQDLTTSYQKTEKKLEAFIKPGGETIVDLLGEMKSDQDFMKELWSSRMTPQEQLDAIQKRGWMDYRGTDPEERKTKEAEKARKIKVLTLLVKVDNVGKYAGQVVAVGQILDNLGIYDERIAKVVDFASRVESLATGIMQVASGNFGILTGMANITSAFRKKSDNGQKQVIAMLNKILELQVEMLKLQLKMQDDIINMRVQMYTGFNDLKLQVEDVNKNVKLVHRGLAGDRLESLKACRESRESMLRGIHRNRLNNNAPEDEVLNNHVESMPDEVPLEIYPVEELMQVYFGIDTADQNGLDACVKLMSGNLSDVNLQDYNLSGILNLAQTVTEEETGSMVDAIQSWNKVLRNLYLNHYAKDGILNPEVVFSAQNPSPDFKSLFKKINYVSSPEGKKAMAIAQGHRHWKFQEQQVLKPPVDTIINTQILSQMVRALYEIYPMDAIRRTEGKREKLFALQQMDPKQVGYLETALAYVEAAIVQQAIYYGDYILADVNKELNLHPNFNTATDSVAFFIGENMVEKQRDIHYALFGNPIFRQNVLNYRIMDKLQSLPATGYEYAYNYTRADGTHDPFYLNGFLEGTGIYSNWDDARQVWVMAYTGYSTKSNPDRKEELDPQLRLISDKEVGYKEVPDKKAEADQEYVNFKAAHTVAVPLPMPEQFARGELAYSAGLNDLYTARMMLLKDLLYYQTPTLKLKPEEKNRIALDALIGAGL